MSAIEKILRAIEENDLQTLKQVWDADVANFVGVEQAPYVADNPLHHAIDLDRYHLIKYMLENGADPNLQTADSRFMPIRIAIWWVVTPTPCVVEVLMKHGANPYMNNKHGRTAFGPGDGMAFQNLLNYLESYLVVELVTGEADNLPLDMWRVVTPFLYKL